MIILDRMRIFEFMVLLISALAAAGFLLAFGANADLIGAALIYLLGVFISHIAAVGFRIRGLLGRGGIKSGAAANMAVMLAVGAAFGYRFVLMLHLRPYSVMIYILLWYAYLRYERAIAAEL